MRTSRKAYYFVQLLVSSNAEDDFSRSHFDGGGPPSMTSQRPIVMGCLHRPLRHRRRTYELVLTSSFGPVDGLRDCVGISIFCRLAEATTGGHFRNSTPLPGQAKLGALNAHMMHPKPKGARQHVPAMLPASLLRGSCAASSSSLRPSTLLETEKRVPKLHHNRAAAWGRPALAKRRRFLAPSAPERSRERVNF